VRKIDTNLERDFIATCYCKESIWDLYEHRHNIEGASISYSGFFAVTSTALLWVKM
jgi:hypothetical protein